MQRPPLIMEIVALGVFGAIVAEASRAGACGSNEWQQDNGDFYGSPGCASAIAVGPNNIPWIIGCGANPHVFYLSGNCAPGGGLSATTNG
jgi:hypothetical protein